MRIDGFQDFLEKDLAWRKMEISQLFYILNKVDTTIKDVVGKSMILLLYAHWEGFIKKSSKYYLRYVSEEKIKLNELTRNFEAISLKNYARECIDKDSKNLQKEFAFMDAQYKMGDKPFHVNVDCDNEFDVDIIDTRHNLSSKVWKGIVQIVGIEYNNEMKVRDTILDNNLLKHRNSIGHGSQIDSSGEETSPLDFDRLVKLKNFILSMLDYYAEILMKYVEEEYYLKQNAKSRDAFEKEQEAKLTKRLSVLIESKEVK